MGFDISQIKSLFALGRNNAARDQEPQTQPINIQRLEHAAKTDRLSFQIGFADSFGVLGQMTLTDQDGSHNFSFTYTSTIGPQTQQRHQSFTLRAKDFSQDVVLDVRGVADKKLPETITAMEQAVSDKENLHKPIILELPDKED